MKKNNVKKAVAILVNDIHLTKNNGALVQSIFDQIIHKCQVRKIKHIFCGGDVFTNRSGQPLSCLIEWNNIITKVVASGLTLHVIPGNHDKTNPDDEESYLDVFSRRGFFLYKNSTLHIDDENEFVAGFIPYFTDEKWLSELQFLENYVKCEVPENYSKILISHIGFDGVKNNDGSTVESIIKPSLLKKWDKVLLGHYHNASKLSSNIYYTGSAYQNNFGENITDKGFTVIYNDSTTEFIPSIFPKYIKEVISADDKLTLKNLLERYEGDEENFIRFQFVGKKVDFLNIDVEEIQSKRIDVKFVNNETVEAMEVAENDVLCYDKKTIKRDFLEFCKENNISGKNLSFGFNLIKNI